jgi:hypothetical protein
MGMIYTSVVRALRTPTSERLLLVRDAREIAVVEVHFPPQGGAICTLIVLEDSGIHERDIPTLLEAIDRDLLPNARRSDDTLEFSVVIARALGTFTPDSKRAERMQ